MRMVIERLERGGKAELPLCRNSRHEKRLQSGLPQFAVCR